MFRPTTTKIAKFLLRNFAWIFAQTPIKEICA